MTIQEAQERVDAWIRQYGVRYFSELTNMAVLTEEVGEVARVIARRYGDQSSKPGDDLDLADELADVLWVVMCLANQTGIDLDAALERNFAKKTARDSHRHLDNEKLCASRKPYARVMETMCQPKAIKHVLMAEAPPELWKLCASRKP